MGRLLLNLLQDAIQVIGLRRLQSRELLVRHELLQPQQLADGQDVPVVEISGARGGQCPANGQRALLIFPDGLLERIALDVLDLGPVIGHGWPKRGGAGGAHHRVVELPVLVAHRRRERARIVEEGVARRLLRLAFQIVALDTFFYYTDRKSTRLNSSHQIISYAVFCLKKKKKRQCVVTES